MIYANNSFIHAISQCSFSAYRLSQEIGIHHSVIIPYFDEQGRKLDFHALRHTFITTLRSVPTRVAQSLARPKSSKMTDRYTHIGLVDERAVIEEAIPDYSLSSSHERNIATGADDLALSDDFSKENSKQSEKTDDVEMQHVERKEVTRVVNNDTKGFLIRRSQVRILASVLFK